MKLTLIIVGVLLFLVGAVWILQGLNVLTQGQMAGDLKWTRIGAILAVVGAALFVVGLLRKKAKNST